MLLSSKPPEPDDDHTLESNRRSFIPLIHSKLKENKSMKLSQEVITRSYSNITSELIPMFATKNS